MSGGISCKCAGHRTRAFRLANWVIVQWRSNRSAFNGYRRTSSDYSEIRCNQCGTFWRTKAGYVDDLPTAK